MTSPSSKRFEVKVAPNGRMVIPLDVRRQMGIENGGSIWIESGDIGATMRSRLQGLRRAQEIAWEVLKDEPWSAVDELIADRRAEFARELEKEREMFGE